MVLLVPFMHIQNDHKQYTYNEFVSKHSCGLFSKASGNSSSSNSRKHLRNYSKKYVNCNNYLELLDSYTYLKDIKLTSINTSMRKLFYTQYNMMSVLS